MMRGDRPAPGEASDMSTTMTIGTCSIARQTGFVLAAGGSSKQGGLRL